MNKPELLDGAIKRARGGRRNSLMKPTKRQLLMHNPCSEGKAFIAKHKTLKAAWLACEKPEWMIWALSKLVVWDETTARKFAIACAEHTLHFFEDKYSEDKRPRLAIEAAKAILGGTFAARSAARSAAGSAARSAARSAAGSAARSAAESAAWSAESAAWSAAESAAWSAESAAWSAAESNEEKWQSETLRNIINPFAL